MLNNRSTFFNIKKKDKLKRKNYSQNESSSFISFVLFETRVANVSTLLNHKHVFSKVSIRNRCVLTGRTKSVLSKFRLSRLTFRRLALSGFIPGIRKAAW